MELKETLLAAKSRLFEAAKEVCSDKAFAYDILYLAVLKTKQRYKKLINKDRTVYFCISLMKQPKKHVKQSFESVEDCIEKALVAKVVSWKPILSAVAVVLAAAIVVPFCLSEEPTYVNPKGFTMSGAMAFTNNTGSDSITLQNYHKISELGVHDIFELSGVEMGVSGFANGDARYKAITTTLGTTLLTQSYVNGNTKKAEFILYKAYEDGWHEVGRDNIRFQVTTHPRLGQSYTIDNTELLVVPNGDAYIVSTYEEGIQIHKYGADGSFQFIGKCYISKRHTVINPAASVTSFLKVSLCYDKHTNRIHLLCKAEQSYRVEKAYYISFDITTQKFSEPYHIERLDDAGITVMGQLCPDESGGVYFALREIPDGESPSILHYIYHIDNNKNLSCIVQYGAYKSSANASSQIIEPRSLEFINGELHFIYRNGLRTDYIVYQDGIEKSRMHVASFTTDPGSYMGFFFHEDTLYYAALINYQYVCLAKVTNEKTEKVAEFELPITNLSCSAYTDTYGMKLDTSNGTINYIVGEIEHAESSNVLSSYFFQIILR